jgi:teichuronic acid biosynthesis glycosyltransferase TuaC
MKTIKTLTFTTLFPNAAQPVHGIFVANRLGHLLGSRKVATRVVAPVPMFFSTNRRFGIYAQYASVPRIEERFNTTILHPRYALLPKVGMNVAPGLLYCGALRSVSGVQREFDFDLIDAHYFYPDGIAAVLLGRRFGKPVVITARGSDINQIADYAIPRRMILWAASRAAGLITVCQALKDRLVEIGVAQERITVLRNGVDLRFFRPQPRDAIRGRLSLTGKVAISVGHLIPRKGHDLVIDAVVKLPDTTLLIAGDGPELQRLKAQTVERGIEGRVRFLGQVASAQLVELYSAADLLVLASSREGWPNVLLEAMACGTPVVASRVWGTPEVVTKPAAGLLVEERTSSAFAAAIGSILKAPPDRANTRAYAEEFSWDSTTAGQLRLFEGVLRRGTTH